jgi:glycerol kinase
VILAIDQGTTGTACLVVDESLRIAGRGYRELTQHFPRPGWVEHDPEEIWDGVLAAAGAALADAGLPPESLEAVCVTNQRETTLLWDRRTGTPVDRAIVWQDRRTAERCARLDRELIRSRTGLVPDPYFSATKLEWLLERHDARGLAFGTVDSWLVWRLTGGTRHVTDVTNASRTMLCALETRDWDDELLALFGVDRGLLPEIVGSAAEVGEAELLGARVALRGIAGDQQAALFGHGCHVPGSGKATYGTGSFVLVHTGDDAGPPPHGLLRTVAADGYALEGAVLVAGAALQWLRDGLGVIDAAAESEALATSVEDTGGVVFVPALAGLGSPWWDAGARGLITGLTRGTTRAHLVRAALEAIAHQVADVVDALPGSLELLRADGGATGNAFLMQLQADLLRLPIHVAAEQETTSLGVAALCAGGEARVPVGAVFEPRLDADRAAEERARWETALARARSDFGS